MTYHPHSLDQRLYLDVNHFARSTAWLHSVAAPFALWIGVTILGVILIIGCWISRKAQDPVLAVSKALWVGVACFISLGANQIVAHLVKRVRPYYTMPHVEVLVAKAHDYTFPSDHAVVAGTVIAGMWLVSKRLAWIATVVGLVLGFARVYVGAHYPSDVVAGLLLGAAICLVLAKPMTRLIKFFVSAIVKTPLRPLVIAKRD